MGLLVIRKPRGPTSHEVVLRVREKLGIRRIGHGGTLDPMAEGLLIVLVGRATKRQALVQRLRKTYEATIRLGEQTDTGDAEGRVIRRAAVPTLTREAVDVAVGSFVGPLEQVPPAFSAVKVHGRPLYWWTRHGRQPDVRLRRVEIFTSRLLAWDPATSELSCRVTCSSGTYIRALAETLAHRLNTVGHVSALNRIAVGAWTIERARSLDAIRTATGREVSAWIEPVRELEAAACQAFAPDNRN